MDTSNAKVGILIEFESCGCVRERGRERERIRMRERDLESNQSIAHMHAPERYDS